MSVNQSRTKRMSRSCTSDITSSAVRGAAVLVIGERTLLARGWSGPYGEVVRIRLSAIVVGVAVAGCVPAAGMSASSGRARACVPDRARTLIANDRAAVYALAAGVYGCTA